MDILSLEEICDLAFLEVKMQDDMYKRLQEYNSGKNDEAKENGKQMKVETKSRKKKGKQAHEEEGTEGVVGLSRWYEKMESVFHISGCAIENQETLKKKMTDKYCSRGEIKKLEIKLWNLKVKGNDVVSYTQRFQELALMCTKFVSDEMEKVDKYIGGLPDNVHGNVMKEYDETLPLCNKCKFHHNGPCTTKCTDCKKVGHLTRDCWNPTATSIQRTITCYKYGKQMHYKSDCPELKNQNHRNQAKGTEERGMMIQAVRDWQKSYADLKRKPMDFQVRPFNVLSKVRDVAYRLELTQQLSRVHNIFHVSNLKKCLSDESLMIPLDELHVDDKLHVVEEPVEIMDREIKQLKRSRIPLIKVRWNSKRGPEFTWEREDQFKKTYPHLFTKTVSSSSN
nr:putative reverse transcriptase domain-containing protein [Tanacetum cinerariifolium]